MATGDLPPRISTAFDQFVEEAIQDAIDTILHGSDAAKLPLQKMVLGELFRSRAESGGSEVEEMLDQTRQMIMGIFSQDEEGVDDDSDDDTDDSPPSN